MDGISRELRHHAHCPTHPVAILRLVERIPDGDIFVVTLDDELGVADVVSDDVTACPSTIACELSYCQLKSSPERLSVNALLNKASGVSQWNRVTTLLIPFASMFAKTSS